MGGRRDDIVAAAAKVFKEKGYHQSTTEDIAAEVGMLKGSLYYYIEKKEDLLYAVIEPPVRRMVQTLQQIASMQCSAGEKVERVVATHLETFDAEYPHIFVYLQELSHGMTLRPDNSIGSELIKLGKEYRALVGQIIADGIEHGEFDPDLDPRIAALGLLGMCNWMQKWYRPGGRAQTTDVARTFVAILLNGLTGTRGLTGSEKRCSDSALETGANRLGQP